MSTQFLQKNYGQHCCLKIWTLSHQALLINIERIKTAIKYWSQLKKVTFSTFERYIGGSKGGSMRCLLTTLYLMPVLVRFVILFVGKAQVIAIEKDECYLSKDLLPSNNTKIERILSWIFSLCSRIFPSLCPFFQLTKQNITFDAVFCHFTIRHFFELRGKNSLFLSNFLLHLVNGRVSSGDLSTRWISDADRFCLNF